MNYTVPPGLSIDFFFGGKEINRKGRALSPSFAVTREGHYGSVESPSLPEKPCRSWKATSFFVQVYTPDHNLIIKEGWVFCHFAHSELSPLLFSCSFLCPTQDPVNGCISHQLCIINKLAEGDFVTSSKLLIKMLKYTAPSIKPWNTPLVIGLQLDFALLTTIFYVWSFGQFSICLTLHLSNLHFLNMSMRMLWRTVSKALLKPI